MPRDQHFHIPATTNAKRPQPVRQHRCRYDIPTVGDLLTARPTGLTETESWAILCQAVQALQDLFLSATLPLHGAEQVAPSKDGASGETCVPFLTPSTLLLSSRGRVKFQQSSASAGEPPPAHLTGYLAPEYRPNKQYSDTEIEKMWIYSLGETLKRATLTSHAATSRLSGELCQVFSDMTRPQASSRASLMHLLDVISEYCKRRQPTRPFSHVVMDLHQEAMAALEAALDTPWGPPAMPELRTITRNSTEQTNTLTIPRRWMGLRRTSNEKPPKLTREASTSMEEIAFSTHLSNEPGATVRPKSMCAPNMHCDQDIFDLHRRFQNFTCDQRVENNERRQHEELNDNNPIHMLSRSNTNREHTPAQVKKQQSITGKTGKMRKSKCRRNPVQRAASRLYRAVGDPSTTMGRDRECVGPEFVVKSTLPSKQYTVTDAKGNARKTVTVILLNGQKVDVVCNPNVMTAGQLFELIIQKELIEENFMLGLSALIAGDFVFLPSDTRICKAAMPGGSHSVNLTLFLRVRFFLPSLRGVRGSQARHLLYLQLRRSVLEHQLPCSFSQLVDLNGFALQAEFGDYNEREHGTRDYFLLEHYVPETMASTVSDSKSLRYDLTRAHKYKLGMDVERAEEEFILLAQTLPHYGGHFYTAIWVLKDNTQRNVWLYISAQGINIYERSNSPSYCGPKLYEMFEWRTIQTLCYSKHYLCVLPHSSKLHPSKLKKYKLRMDHKKSYFTFRLASLHHQFFLRLRTEFTSLQTLSQQFGIPLKDMKNETNSLFKLEALTNPYLTLDKGSVNAETEFKIEFRSSLRDSAGSSRQNGGNEQRRRSKSVNDFKAVNYDELIGEEDRQNKENENPTFKHGRAGLVLDSGCLSGFPNLPPTCDKRRGVKMGTRAFSTGGNRVSRSMEAMNVLACEDLEQLSLQSVSINYSSSSTPQSPTNESKINTEAYIIGSSSIKSDNNFLPDLHETLSGSLIEKLNNFSYDDERILQSVTVAKDFKGSLGMQITEGSDGNVYVQSVIPGGPAHRTGRIFSGDQIIAVDGKNLLRLKYEEALNLLKSTGNAVSFVLSQTNVSRYLPNCSKSKQSTSIDTTNRSKLQRTMDKLKQISQSQIFDYSRRSLERLDLDDVTLEKHLTENCYDISNLRKYNPIYNNSVPNNGSVEVPYHKHIRYEIEPAAFAGAMNKSLSKSCTQIYCRENRDNNNRAVVVDMIPKSRTSVENFRSLDRKLPNENDRPALPRSLGLSRKWRGPVRYPVTPVKKTPNSDDNSVDLTTSDEEQVFI